MEAYIPCVVCEAFITRPREVWTGLSLENALFEQHVHVKLAPPRPPREPERIDQQYPNLTIEQYNGVISCIMRKEGFDFLNEYPEEDCTTETEAECWNKAYQLYVIRQAKLQAKKIILPSISYLFLRQIGM